MKNILVTGGAGFVGSRLALGLKERFGGARVRSLDNLRRRGSELNLPRLRAGGVEFVHGDIRNPEDLELGDALDLILECSAEPSVLAGYDGSPQYVVNTNLTGTLNCLELARRTGAATIFLSTSRVYPMAAINGLNYVERESRFDLGENPNVPGVSAAGFSEDFPLAGARSLYGATKLCSELVFAEYMAMYGLRGVINRCGVLAGPWQMGKVDQGVAVLWAARHLLGGSLSYIGFGGGGKQVRDLLHIDDLMELVFKQIELLDTCSGHTFNVGGGREVSLSLLEMTALCEEFSGRAITIGRQPETRAGDIRLYLTDNGRVTAKTGWRPARDARVIMEDICRWISANRAILASVLG